MNRTTYLAMTALLALPLADVARAVSITVPDYSFETNTPADGAGVTPGPHWVHGSDAGNSAGIWNWQNAQFPNSTNGALPSPAHGNNAAWSQLGMNVTDGYISTLTSAVSLGPIQGQTLYTLTVAVGERADQYPVQNISIALLANGVQIPGAINTIAGSDIDGGTFEDLTATFTSLNGNPFVGQDLTIQLIHSRTTLGGRHQAIFDNVRLSATEIPLPAPEPASGAILGLGGMLVLGLTRRRHGKK